MNKSDRWVEERLRAVVVACSEQGVSDVPVRSLEKLLKRDGEATQYADPADVEVQKLAADHAHTWEMSLLEGGLRAIEAF